ncbi:type IV toxin-antitoxin system AbiEi family antitoxin domain-containing protein [Sinomicrobium sp.]
MEITQLISKYADYPLPHQLLISWLKGYKRPNDKILGLKDKGFLKPLKKGLYIAGPSATDRKPDAMLVANHLLGPSYVSLETAMSFHGLIPERVYEISSMTTKASRQFDTTMGLFTYTRLPLPYYSFGLNMLQLSSNQYAIVASAEKALCDKIVNTSGLSLRSIRSTHEFLVDDMRIDEATLKDLDLNAIRQWLPYTPKRDSLLTLIKTIERL